LPNCFDNWLQGGFYVGTHHITHARVLKRSFISVNRIRARRSSFLSNPWIMDSGAFTELSTYGFYRHSYETYFQDIQRWSQHPRLVAAVSQDYMCEPAILKKTGLSVEEHQRLTVERYDGIMGLSPKVTIIPVVQGYSPKEYQNCIQLYGDRLKGGMWVGVGSICKRNSNPMSVWRVLSAITAIRPDLRLHGFGLKVTSLSDPRILRRLYTADSMAWSYAARRDGRGPDANRVSEALLFESMINERVNDLRDQYSVK
jgi:hypothetical protein